MPVRSYQMSHQHRVSQTNRKSIPQAKFSYLLAPMEVHVVGTGKRWYEFLTSVLAIVGGAFTVMGLSQGVMSSVNAMIKGNIGKLS